MKADASEEAPPKYYIPYYGNPEQRYPQLQEPPPPPLWDIKIVRQHCSGYTTWKASLKFLADCLPSLHRMGILSQCLGCTTYCRKFVETWIAFASFRIPSGSMHSLVGSFRLRVTVHKGALLRGYHNSYYPLL